MRTVTPKDIAPLFDALQAPVRPANIGKCLATGRNTLALARPGAQSAVYGWPGRPQFQQWRTGAPAASAALARPADAQRLATQRARR
jgi:hypothetical protein